MKSLRGRIYRQHPTLVGVRVREVIHEFELPLDPECGGALFFVELDDYGDVTSLGSYQGAPEVVTWPTGDGGENDGTNITTRIEAPARCRSADCRMQFEIASEKERVTCWVCREWMGLAQIQKEPQE